MNNYPIGTFVYSAIFVCIFASTMQAKEVCLDGKGFWTRVKIFVQSHSLNQLTEVVSPETKTEIYVGPYESDTVQKRPVREVVEKIQFAARNSELKIANEKNANQYAFVEITGWKNAGFKTGVFAAEKIGTCWHWKGFYDDTPPPN